MADQEGQIILIDSSLKKLQTKIIQDNKKILNNQFFFPSVMLSHIKFKKHNLSLYIIKQEQQPSSQMKAIPQQTNSILNSDQRAVKDNYLSLTESTINGPNISGIDCKQQDKLWRRYSSIVRISLIVFSIFLILFNSLHLYSYVKASKEKKIGKNTDDKISDHLKYLTTWWILPYFNRYFYEEYIYELGRKKKWYELIQQAQKALQYSVNTQKFSIYYHKAMAECFIQQFYECKKSINQAYKYSEKEMIPDVLNIYGILQSNNIIKSNQIPNQSKIQSQAKQKNGRSTETLEEL